jgi:hypothetical protein
MSVSSLVGRLSSGFLARPAGVRNLLVGSTACCAIVIFAMIGLKTTGSVVTIAILYGYFAGMCRVDRAMKIYQWLKFYFLIKLLLLLLHFWPPWRTTYQK